MKFISTLFLFFVAIATFSQEETEEVFPRDIAKNELSINAFNLVTFGAIDIAYERIIDSNSSWAIEGFVLALNRESEAADYIFTRTASFTGKYKYYFGENSAYGFYVNGLAMVSTGEYYEEIETFDGVNYNYSRVDKEYTDLALGFGVGYKWVSKQGFFMDLNTGIGRNLLNNDSPIIVGQFNVNLGKRF